MFLSDFGTWRLRSHSLDLEESDLTPLMNQIPNRTIRIACQNLRTRNLRTAERVTVSVVFDSTAHCSHRFVKLRMYVEIVIGRFSFSYKFLNFLKPLST